ncbi:hypothetical protein [Carp edema virus]|nr:hypothetical protein [Carp edema virus]
MEAAWVNKLEKINPKNVTKHPIIFSPVYVSPEIEVEERSFLSSFLQSFFVLIPILQLVVIILLLFTFFYTESNWILNKIFKVDILTQEELNIKNTFLNFDTKLSNAKLFCSNGYLGYTWENENRFILYQGNKINLGSKCENLLLK